MVVLREIFVSTEKKARGGHSHPPQEAENLRDRVLKNGDDFGELAKRFSDRPYRAAIGRNSAPRAVQTRSNISEKGVALNRGQMTDVIETKTGFEILQVRERYIKQAISH